MVAAVLALAVYTTKYILYTTFKGVLSVLKFCILSHHWLLTVKERKNPDSDKLSIRQDHPHCPIEMKFCMVGVLQEIVLRFDFHENRSSGFGAVGGGRNLPFPIDLAIGLYDSLYYNTSHDD